MKISNTEIRFGLALDALVTIAYCNVKNPAEYAKKVVDGLKNMGKYQELDFSYYLNDEGCIRTKDIVDNY